MSEIQTGDGGGGKGGKVRAKKMSTKIDMTPMVDLGFLLLTFFILTTTFNKPTTMEINMPEKIKENEEPPPKVNDEKVVTLVLGANNKIYWYKGITEPVIQVTDYSQNGIRKVLLKQKNEVNGLVLLIKPDETSTYKNVVDILDEMNITKMRIYAMVDITPEDKALVKESNL